jgi:hypothetical protein
MLLERKRQIDQAEDGEHERLNQRYERSQQEQDRDDEFRQVGEDTEHEVVAGHVAEESKGQRDRPHQVVDELERQHQECQPPDRPQEMLQVGHALLLKAEVVVEQERGDAEGESDVEVAGRRRNPGSRPRLAAR